MFGPTRLKTSVAFPQKTMPRRYARWLKAAMTGLLMGALCPASVFAWQEKDKAKSKPPRLQLYPNRETEIDPREKEYQESRAELLAKARKNARTQLDAMRVELAWLADPLLFAHPPGIKAILTEGNQVVEIRGVVQSHAIRERALELAKRHSETPVRDKLLVLISPSKGRQEVATEELQARAEKFLTEKLIEFSQDLRIEEVYPSGTIRIGGRVLSYEDKLSISRAFRRLTGCMGVDNRVEVSPMTQDGELVTLVTSDGEAFLPGRLEEKRNGPVAMAPPREPHSTAVATEKRTRVEPVEVAAPAMPITSVRAERKARETQKETEDSRAERPTPMEPRVATVNSGASLTRETQTKVEADRKVELAPPPKLLGPAPTTKPATSPEGAVTTGVATLDEEAESLPGQGKVEPVVGWGQRLFPSAAPATQTLPDGTPVETVQRPFLGQRPRLLMQPSPTTVPAQRGPAPVAPQRTPSVRMMPGTPAPQPSPEEVSNSSGQRRGGFVNGLGQPILPRTQPYLSPVEVSQSGRAIAPVVQPSPGQESSNSPRMLGSVQRHYQGRPVALPGSVRMGSQPGAPLPAPLTTPEATATHRWPWDKPVEDEAPAPPMVRPGRAPSVAAWSGGVGQTRNTPAPLPERQPIATSVSRPATSFEDEPSPTVLNRPESPRPGLGSVEFDPEPALPKNRPAAEASRLPQPKPTGPSLSLPQPTRTTPAGELPPPSTGSVTIEPEPNQVPPFVPIRRPERSQPRESVPAQGNRSVPSARVGNAPAPESPAAGLGTIELDSDAIKRPLPAPESLVELAKKTCGGLISEIKTRKEGGAIAVEITVKDALAEDEVLKRLCNLSAFTHPGIRIEVTRAP